MKTLVCTVGVLGVLLTGVLRAEEGGITPSVSLSAGAFTKYVWRFQAVNTDRVLQPDLAVGIGDFSLDVWGNMDLTHHNGGQLAGQFTEIDLTVDYSHTFEDLVTIGGGIISYEFPNSSTASTHEVYAGIGLALHDLFSPSATVYYDFDEVKSGVFLEVGFEGSIGLPEIPLPVKPVSIDYGASVAYSNAVYNKGYFGGTADDHALGGGQVSVGIPFVIENVDCLTITPSCQFTTLWDSDIRDNVSHPDNVIWGLTLGLEF